MPLSYNRPLKINKNFRRIRQALSVVLNSYLAPAKMILLFFIIASILAFLKITAVGFYVVFGLFIVGYFCEKIIYNLKKYGRNRENQKGSL